jgi:hypothetical protein
MRRRNVAVAVAAAVVAAAMGNTNAAGLKLR